MEKITQTAGRDQLGGFAPDFAHYNDDILFGENWNNQDIDLKTRCMITVVALMASGITDSSLKYHLENAPCRCPFLLIPPFTVYADKDLPAA